MNDTHSPTRRATLLIGYGDFGRDVLRRLLVSAAPRGVLDWEEPTGGARLCDRTLRDLALLHVPDRLGLDRDTSRLDDTTADQGPIGIVGDLYRQVQVLEPRADPETDLAEAAVGVAEKLLSASSRARRTEAQPFGLDVVVVAHPAAPEVLGLLDNMLAAAMDALANNANLVRAVQGAEALNVLEILDFENYWDAAETGHGLRRAVSNSLAQWEKRRFAGRPALGRVYLVDGRTADGFRDERHRSDEITLFLELLLFEGQRGGELQRLWQPAGAHESPLAAFGVRLMEKSTGLLSRLAAARFAVDWLGYLAGDKPAGGAAQRSETAERLAPYRVEELDRWLGTEELRGDVAGELSALEGELLALPMEDPAWPAQVGERYAETARRLNAHLAETTGRRVEDLHRERLDKLHDDLREGVERDLHHDRRPLPLGLVIGRLEQAGAGLEAEAVPEPPVLTEASSTVLEGLGAAYRRFRRGQVDRDGLRQWWPLWAGALAVGMAPSLGALVADIPPPDTTQVLLTKLYGALQWINNPIALSVLVFLAAWALGARLLAGRIAARQTRAARFYLDVERGRFADGLRREIEPTGTLGSPLYRELELTLRDTALAVRGVVGREIGRVLERLGDRRREMQWLAEELRDFLKLHGVTLAGDWHELDRHRKDGTGIRHSVERGEDLERMLERNPPAPERFASTQADQRPFEGWDARYGEAFLYPLPFLDRLSRIYEDGHRELAEPESDFAVFLDRYGSFDLAFAWKAQEGVPAERRYALLPAPWRRLPGVLDRLADLATMESEVLSGSDASRAYLLRLQTGIAPGCLLEASS